MRLLLTVFIALASTSLGLAQTSRPTKEGPAPEQPAPEQPAKEQPASQPVKPKRSPLPPLGHPSGVFGAGVQLGKSIPLETAAKQVKDLHGRTIRVDGLLKDVCRKKGCWTVLRDGKSEVRVKFRDYAFFVPRDAAGRRALVEGIVTAKTISEAEAKHYAEESGDPESAKDIKGPQKVLAFTAIGVEILGKTALPPLAQGDAEAMTKLVAKVAAGPEVKQRRKAACDSLKSAMALLRRVKGPRTVEFNLCAELKTSSGTWHVFSSSKRGFETGFAVNSDGTVKSF